MDLYLAFFLILFLASTPIAVLCAHIYEHDHFLCAIVNSYAFSVGMIGLYAYPFFDTRLKLDGRIHKATMNWILWLSVFTEIVFQIPHNLLVKQLYEVRGSALEWPFFSYGLSDSRWNDYHHGTGLAPEVWLINLNDAGLGIVVAIALFCYKYQIRSRDSRRSALAVGSGNGGCGDADDSCPCVLPGRFNWAIVLALVTVFRDATLWRETVEYMWDHHRKGYPFTTTDPIYRPHAIAILWLVNIVWLIAPISTIFWAHNCIMKCITAATHQTKKAA